MNPRNVLFFALGAVFFTGIAYAAPSYVFQPSIVPQSDNTYTLGTTTKAYKDIFTYELCLSGDCRSTWPAGGTGGSGFSTTSADYWLTLNRGNAFSTTSADAWKNQRDFFATSSAFYFLSQNQATAFSTTSANYFLSQNLANAFSTTSASWFLSQNTGSAFSTTSASYFLLQNQGSAFSTSSANYWESTQSARGASPGGPTNAVQLNDGAGGFTGSASLTWDGTNLSIGSESAVSNIHGADATTPDTSGGSLVIRGGAENGAGQPGMFALGSGQNVLIAGGTISSMPYDYIGITTNAEDYAFLDTSLLTNHALVQFPAALSGTTDTLCFQSLGNCGGGTGFSTTSANYWVDQYSKGYFFSTTSADVWGSSKGYITGIAWGAITGTLANQADLNARFATKFGTSSTVTNGQLAYISNNNSLASVATTTASCSGSVSCSTFSILGSSPVTITGTGGTSGMSGWATSTTAWGQLLIYPTLGTEDVVFGRTSTSSAPFWWDVSATTSYIGNGGNGDSFIGIGPVANQWTMGFSSSTKRFEIASSSSIGTNTAFYIDKNLTSYFANGFISGASSTFMGRINGTTGFTMGSSSPWAKMTVQRTYGEQFAPIFVVASSTSATGLNGTVFFSVSHNGTVGIGTTTPWAKFDILKTYGHLNNPLFRIASSTNANGLTSTNLFVVSNTGAVTTASSLAIGGALSGVSNISMSGTLSGGTTIAHSNTYTQTRTTLATSTRNAYGILLTNSTAATAALNGQMAPSILFTGTAWNGTASVPNRWAISAVPWASGFITSGPTSTLSFGWSSHTLSTSTVFTIDSSGLASTSRAFSIAGVNVSPFQYASYSYASSTAWTGTTTRLMEQAFVSTTYYGVKCKTKPSGSTVLIQIGNGSASTTGVLASSTNNTISFATPVVFSAGSSISMDFGTPGSSPIEASCTTKRSFNE